MVIFMGLFLLLVLHESLSANNETTKQTKNYSVDNTNLPEIQQNILSLKNGTKKQVSAQNSPVHNTKLPEIQQNILSLKNGTKKQVSAQNSPVHNTKLPEIQQNILSLKNGTKKQVSAQNSPVHNTKLPEIQQNILSLKNGTKKQVSAQNSPVHNTNLPKIQQNILSLKNGTKKQVSAQNSPVHNTNLPKIQQNIFTMKNNTKKRSNKLTQVKDSIELTKLRLHSKKTRRKVAKILSWKYPPSNCRKIKCPSEERPVCAKLAYVNPKTNEKMRPLNVIMINKCEIQYAACYRGLKATIVPMKNCHAKLKKTSVIIATGGTSRAKGEIEVEKLHDYEASDDPEIKQGTIIELEDPNYPDYETEHDNDVGDNDVVNERSSADGRDYEAGEFGDNPDHEANSGFGDEESMKNEAPSYAALDVYESDHHTAEDDLGYDKVQDQEQCPKVCPDRDVMVCAKCQHGIYKTFLSVCQMRVFQCTNMEEKLQLVTRYPCVMSAPYISEKPQMRPEGRVSEPGDNDSIMSFIRCRQKGTLDKNVKCKFDKIKKLNQVANVQTLSANENTEY